MHLEDRRLTCVNSKPVYEAAKRAVPKSVQSAATSVPWYQRRFIHLRTASEVSGRSVPGLYADAKAGKLKFRDLGGRTVVEVESLIALMDAAPNWTPRDRGKEARAARKRAVSGALRA